MKQSKKIISLVITLAMLISAVSVLGLIPASAAPGDVWSLNNSSTSWTMIGGFTRNATYDGYTSPSSLNKGTARGGRSVLLTNKRTEGNNQVKASTKYEVSFTICAENATITDFYAQLYTAPCLYNNQDTNIVTFSDLTAYATQTEWTSFPKWRVTLPYVTAADLSTAVSTSYPYPYIALSALFGGHTTYVTNIQVKEIGTYRDVDVYDGDTQEKLGTLAVMDGDDAYAAITGSAYDKSGYSFDVEPAEIESTTDRLDVYYYENLVDVQNIDFGNDYAGGTPDWHYKGSQVTVSGGVAKFENPNENQSFCDRAVLLANDYANSGLEAGKTYRLAFDMTFFPRYTPFNKLAAEIHFAATASDDGLVAGSAINLTGEQLENSVISYTPNSSGSVKFRVEFNITLPASGWAASGWTSHKNVALSLYGGEVWLDNVAISTLAEIPLVDANNNSLGSVFGRIGDTVEKFLPDTLFSEEYNVTATPATVENLKTPIVVTKTLKSSIATIVTFNSASGDDNGNLHGSDVTANGSSYKIYSRENASFGQRAVVVANDRKVGVLTPGKTYTLNIKLTTWNNPADMRCAVGFGKTCWPSNDKIKKFTNEEFLASVASSVVDGTKYTYNMAIEFTVPTDFSSNTNVSLSVYGPGNTNVEAYLGKTATILEKSDVTVKSYDGSVVATAKGYAGNEIGDVVSETSNVKFVGITDKFGYEDTTIRSNKYIVRGDVNADFNVNASDLSELINYILGTDVTVDTFGANVNATTLEDSDINLLDLVSLKKKLANQANELDFLTQNNYALAWSYDFNDANMDGDFIDSQWGSNRNVDDIEPVTAGEKQYSYVKDGCLVLAPSDNYGAGKTLVCDAYTTKTTMNFTYGYLEVMAKLPFSSANTPAIWLKSVGDDGHLFEIDLVETFGSTSSISTNIHYWEGDTDHNLNNVDGRSFTITNTEDFHKYGFEWYKENGVSKISFYVDGNLVKTVDASMLNCGNIDFNENMYLIIENVPVTQARYDAISDWAESATVATHNDYPMNAYFDYIKLYQSAEQTDSVLWTK